VAETDRVPGSCILRAFRATRKIQVLVLQMHQNASQLGTTSAPFDAVEFAMPNDCGGIELVVNRLDISSPAIHDAWQRLSSDERLRAERFAFALHRNRFVVARAGLRKLLGERLGVQPNEVDLESAAHGKPALGRRHAKDDLKFNISHSGGVVVFALARGREIGVDIEAVRPLPDRDDMAARCFSDKENEEFRNLPQSEKLEAFFNCWTRKEAVVKALGYGLSFPLDDFDVTLAPGRSARILRLGDMPAEKCGWDIRSFIPVPDYVGAVAFEQQG